MSQKVNMIMAYSQNEIVYIEKKDQKEHLITCKNI